MFSTLPREMCRLAVFGFILICCHARVIEISDQQLEQANRIEKFLEDFKNIMKTGNESLGIPILDPFKMESLPLHIDEKSIKLDALLTNLEANKLSEYDVLNGNLNLLGLKVTMKLSWPLISASTNYKVKGIFDSFNIFGKGKISLAAYDFIFGTELRLKLNGEHLKVKKVSTEIALRALNFKITGLFDDEELSELISSFISDMMPSLIKNHQSIITEEVNNLITKELDTFLADKSIGDLLKMFG